MIKVLILDVYAASGLFGGESAAEVFVSLVGYFYDRIILASSVGCCFGFHPLRDLRFVTNHSTSYCRNILFAGTFTVDRLTVFDEYTRLNTSRTG